jgi:hypothetical protein
VTKRPPTGGLLGLANVVEFYKQTRIDVRGARIQFMSRVEVDKRLLDDFFGVPQPDWMRNERGMWVKIRSISLPIPCVLEWIAPETKRTAQTETEIDPLIVLQETRTTIETTTTRVVGTLRVGDVLADERRGMFTRGVLKGPPKTYKNASRRLDMVLSYGYDKPASHPTQGVWQKSFHDIVDYEPSITGMDLAADVVDTAESSVFVKSEEAANFLTTAIAKLATLKNT